MKLSLLLATLLLFVAPNARAAEPAPSGFTAVQRAEIVQVMRDAMKADPSILRDAIETLQSADEQDAQAEMKAAVAQHRQALVANPGDPVAGNPAGDVTVVEFYDPRCPYCKRMLPAIDAILAKDHGVRLVFKDIPVLGPPSMIAARAILAAGNQGAYLTMQSALMRSPAQPTEDLVRQMAIGLHLDAARLQGDMNSPAIIGKIQANMTLAKALKVQGTPVFIVGDTVIPGAIDQPQLEAAIAQDRKHATN